jgi:hypothetical protein
MYSTVSSVCPQTAVLPAGGTIPYPQELLHMLQLNPREYKERVWLLISVLRNVKELRPHDAVRYMHLLQTLCGSSAIEHAGSIGNASYVLSFRMYGHQVP